MSTLSSLKNNGVNVPFPSAQRAAVRFEAPLSIDPGFSVAIVIVVVIACLLVVVSGWWLDRM
jgi:hypothetical protein